MNFEDLQKTWQCQNPTATVTINADLLLAEVRRNERSFNATIFRRDFLEVAVSFAMTIGFSVWGISSHWWSWFFLAFCCFFVGMFFLVDRRIQRKRQPAKNQSLQGCIERSLMQINHQIWLLNNIFWWYLLPIIIGLCAVGGEAIWAHCGGNPVIMITIGLTFVVTYGFTFSVVYWANRWAVRKQLEPRRDELEALLSSLTA
jgi:hypothetical protein